CFTRHYLKMNNYYRKYYQDILLPAVEESLFFFIQNIKGGIDNDIIAVKTEWVPAEKEFRTFYQHHYQKDSFEYLIGNQIISSPDQKLDNPSSLIKFYLNGRIDLLLETKEKNYIIDFKTGSGSTDQLDFYALLIAGEDNLAGDDKLSFALEKSIYNVLEKKFIGCRPGTEMDLKEKIEENLQLFLEKREYYFEYKSRCKDCIMTDICRVV
ncbi:MAG: PD-(D/E)XK nuclease family protein, partial [bacterium]